MTPEATRRLIRQSSRDTMSADQLRKDQQISLSTHRIQQVLSHQHFLQYGMTKSAPRTSVWHREARVTWCENKLKIYQNWTKIIFCDEKSFTLDVSAGYQFHWKDSRHPPKLFPKRQSGGFFNAVGRHKRQR